MSFTKKKKNIILLLVITIIAIAELFISFYLPLLSNVRHDLNATEQQIQLSVALYFLGLGFSSITYGGLSDIFGRKKIIFLAVFIISISAFAISKTESIYTFLLWRFIQGAGGGGGWPVGNAVLRDIYNDKEFTRANILVHIIAGMIPILSLVAGGYVGEFFGWRFIFEIIATVSFFLALFLLFALPETNFKKQKGNFLSIFNNYRTILLSKNYWQYLITKVLNVAAIFVILGTLPLVYVEIYGLTPKEASATLALGLVFYTISGIISHKISQKYDAFNIVVFAVALILFNALAVILLHYTSCFDSCLKTQFYLSAMFFGFAMVFGNATAKIVSAVPNYSGSCSAMMITLEMLASFLSITLVSFFYNGTLIPMAIFIILASAISLISLRLLK